MIEASFNQYEMVERENGSERLIMVVTEAIPGDIMTTLIFLYYYYEMYVSQVGKTVDNSLVYILLPYDLNETLLILQH